MKRMLLGAVVVYSLVHFAYSGVFWALRTPGGDILSAFPGPLLFQATQRWPSLAKAWLAPTGSNWNYGPVLHFLTFPLILAETRAQAMTILLLMDYGLVAATVWLWLRLLFGNHWRPVEALGLACIWLNYFPLLEAVAGREIELLELFLITWAIWALRKGRQVVAGLAFGTAAMTKFLPLIFLPYLLIKGYRKAFIAAITTVLLIAGMAQALLGFQHSVTFELLSADTTGTYFPAAYANTALINVLYKMFTVFNIDEGHPETLYPHLLRPMGIVLHAIVLAACGWFLFRWRRSRLLELECALLAVVMVLTAPHANTYYMVFALPALSVGFASWMRHADALGVRLKALWVGGLVLSGFLVPMQVLGLLTGLPGVLVARALQLFSLPAFGAICAALMLVELHRHLRAEPAGPRTM